MAKKKSSVCDTGSRACKMATNTPTTTPIATLPSVAHNIASPKCWATYPLVWMTPK